MQHATHVSQGWFSGGEVQDGHCMAAAIIVWVVARSPLPPKLSVESLNAQQHPDASL